MVCIIIVAVSHKPLLGAPRFHARIDHLVALMNVFDHCRLSCMEKRQTWTSDLGSLLLEAKCVVSVWRLDRKLGGIGDTLQDRNEFLVMKIDPKF